MSFLLYNLSKFEDDTHIDIVIPLIPIITDIMIINNKKDNDITILKDTLWCLAYICNVNGILQYL